MQDFTFLFKYLKREKIAIDHDEFKFQIQTHAVYPSLLSITDTLSLFKIENLATQISPADIDDLPNAFVALIKPDDTFTPFLSFIERENDNYTYLYKGQTIHVSKQEFLRLFQSIVLLVENKLVYSYKKEVLYVALLGLIFACSIFINAISILSFCLFILGLLGTYFSVEAISEEIGLKTKFSQTICAASKELDCAAVIHSKKIFLFDRINFSNLSLTFFGSQLLGLLLLTISNQLVSFYHLSTISVILSLPFVAYSIYHQLVVIKKICFICIAITVLIVFELIILLLFNQLSIQLNLTSILYYVLAIACLYTGVVVGKKTIKAKLYFEAQTRDYKRFKMRYSFFKVSLLESKKINDYPIQNTLILGYPNAKLKIIVILSLFCEPCKIVYSLLETILQQFGDKVCFDLRFNFDSEINNTLSLHQSLIHQYISNGSEVFQNIVHEWYESKNEENIKQIVYTKIDSNKTIELLQEQFLWNQANHINFTPAIIIKGHLFPKEYERNDLIYFINNLINDDEF